jgi:hypothetical protein
MPTGLQELQAPRICRRSTQEGSNIVSLMHRPPLPPGDTPSTLAF